MKNQYKRLIQLISDDIELNNKIISILNRRNMVIAEILELMSKDLEEEKTK